MTEREKMLNRKAYKAFCEELLGERQYAKEMISHIIRYGGTYAIKQMAFLTS